MELSFSKKAKLEALNSFKISKNKCCNTSFLQGYFFDIDINEETKEIAFQADIVKSAKTVKKLLNIFGIESYVVTKGKTEIKQVATLFITEQDSVESLLALQLNKVDCQRCSQNFLTGLFITNGVVSNPKKEYQLEFVLKSKEKANWLLSYLENLGFSFKITSRRKSFVVYTKQSENIEDFLAMTGAQNMCLEIMSNKVVKDIRNKVNRLTNCEAANIAKASKASGVHLAAINKLITLGKLEYLPEDLQNIAYLKLDNPELSLTELGNIAQPALTKSSVNRRLKKLCQLAQAEEK